MIRLAQAYRQKLHTFCVLRWGRNKQIWTRDIDKLGDATVETTLFRCCAVSCQRVNETLKMAAHSAADPPIAG